jgi:hypothetical protein
MRCVRCGRPVYNGNSRVIVKNGKKLREHRNCALNKDIPVPVRKHAPVPLTRQAPAFEHETPYRYFVMPGMIERLHNIAAKTLLHGSLMVEIHTIPSSLLEELPSLADGFTEIRIKEGE